MGFIIMLDTIYVTDMCESRWHMPSDSQWGENIVLQQERGPQFASVFQSVLYLE